MGETKDKVRGKVDQAVGGLKEGLGRAAGDPELADEGMAQRSRGQTEENWGKVQGAAKGVADQVGGAVKGAAGKLAGDPRLEAEGDLQRVKGRAERELNR